MTTFKWGTASAPPTISRLDHQLDGGWLLAFRCADRARFDDIVQTIRDMPFDRRQWRADTRVWWLSSKGMDSLAASNALPGLAHRVEEYWLAQAQSGHGQGYQAGGYQMGNAPPAVPEAVAEAFASLFLTTIAPVAVIAASHRALARSHRPDAGGTHDGMQRINLARETCEEWAEHHDGKGASER